MPINQYLRRFFVVALAMICLTPSSASKPISARPVPIAQREIQAIYSKIDAALAQKNVDTVYDYNTDDCEFYDIKGHLLDSEGGRQELVELLNNIDIFQRTAIIISFTGSDREATVIVKEHTLQTVSNNINGRAIKLVADDLFREYWVKTDDGWQRKRSREIKSKDMLHRNF
jgi:hypothetical protein